MHLSLARSAAAVAVHPLSLPSSSAKVGQAELGAHLGKLCARRSGLGFLERTHRLTSQVRGTSPRIPGSLAPLRAGVETLPLFPRRSEAEDRAREVPEPALPTTPGCSGSHFHKGPVPFVWPEKFPSGTLREKGRPPRCDREPGSPARLPPAVPGRQLPWSAAVPGLSASLRLPLRETREARGAGFHGHPGSSRVPAPLPPRGLGAPDTREALGSPGVLPAVDSELHSRLPGWV